MSQSQTHLPKNPRAPYILPVSIAVILCILPLVGVLAPRLLGFLPAAMGLLSLPVFRIITGHWPALSKFYLITAIATVSLAALSSLWAFDSAFALERSGKIALVLFGGAALFTLMHTSEICWPRWLGWVFPLCFLGSALLALSELITHGLIHYSWRSSDVPLMSTNVSITNRAVVLLCLLCPPTLMLLSRAGLLVRTKNMLFTLIVIAMIGILALTDSQSAHLAVLTTAFFWFGFPLARPKVWIVLGALIITGILSSPWLAQILYNTLASHMKGISWFAQAYAADRLEIWDFVARKALESPFYGFGIEATRHVEHFDTPMLYTPLDHVLHPHNAVLQIWIEFGALGALGLSIFVAAMMQILYQATQLCADKTAARLPLSIFMAALVVSCTAYGFWQGWWLGLLTLLSALCVHIIKPHDTIDAVPQ